MITATDNRNADFDEGIMRQWTWKTPAMKAMTMAVCRLAIDCGPGEFSANDLPDFDHGGRGIAGAIFRRLIADGVLARVGQFEGQKFYPKVVYNHEGNKVGVYRLACAARARTLLRVHGRPDPELKQSEMPI